MIFGYILSSTIDLFNVAFGITVGMVWSRSQRAGMAVLAITVALLGLLQYAGGNFSGFVLAVCAMGVWAWVTLYLARIRQRADAATKEQQTLKP